jgi:glycosyltransferase involved in cell wall biosynthesis
MVISMGTDTEYYHPVLVQKQEASIVFHGNLSYPPNIRAAVEFANEILPLVRRKIPDAGFHLVGANPEREVRALASQPGIQLSADLEDLRASVCAARVYASAVRHGSGLKNKIIEAMAMRLPVVCYPGSASGIDCVSGTHLLVAGTSAEFAALIVELLRNPLRAEEIASAGRGLVEEKYSWESRARMYEQLYAELMAERQNNVNQTVPAGGE